MRVGPHVLKPESVNWLRRELWQGDLSRSALARGLSGQDGWHNPQGQLCAAPVRKALPGLASKLGLELPPARAGPPGRRDREPVGEVAALTEFARSLKQLPGDIRSSGVMLARMVGWRPLNRGPLPGIHMLWRAFEQVQAMRRVP